MLTRAPGQQRVPRGQAQHEVGHSMKLQPAHRARRFFSSFRRRDVDPAIEAPLLAPLTTSERELFDRFSPYDRGHALDVASAVHRHAPDAYQDWVPTAALLHDIGKTASDPGTLTRVVATILDWLGFRPHAARWSESSGTVKTIGLYLRYQEIGAELLAEAGSDRRAVAWALEHHSPESVWTVPVADGRILAAADDGMLD